MYTGGAQVHMVQQYKCLKYMCPKCQLLQTKYQVQIRALT